MAWSISVSNWLFGQAPPSSPFWELWEKKRNSKLLELSPEEQACQRKGKAVGSPPGGEVFAGFESFH